MKILKIRFYITIIIFIPLFSSTNLFSQVTQDTIINDNSDTIPCQITYVNHYSIFYNILENNVKKDKILPRLYVEKMIINSKNITVLEQKFDSHINGYFKKSKLDNKYDALLLKENSSNNLKILADSSFSFKKKDYFKMAMAVELFAKKYKCKLIYVSELNTENNYTFNVKLYDAGENFYRELANSYNQNSICFFRGNNAMEPDEIRLKHNDSIIWLKKNEFVEFKINAIGSENSSNEKSLINDTGQNKYYFVGDISNYKLTSAVLGSLFASVALSSITGSFFIIEYTNNVTKTSNFIGEFMKILHKIP